MEGQENKGFLGAMKSYRLLVGWEYSVVSFWESERKTNPWNNLPTTRRTTLQMVIFNILGRRYFTWYIMLFSI
jgi:heme-degrading monooxygenase HmoA